MKKKTLESCTSLCNSILKDELAQLVRTTNKTKFTAVKSLNHQVRELCMLKPPGPHQLQVQAASFSEDLDQTGNPNQCKSIITLENQWLTGQILPALLLICRVHCLYIYMDLMTISTSTPCSIMSQIPKTSSSMWILRKIYRWCLLTCYMEVR